MEKLEVINIDVVLINDTLMNILKGRKLDISAVSVDLTSLKCAVDLLMFFLLIQINFPNLDFSFSAASKSLICTLQVFLHY